MKNRMKQKNKTNELSKYNVCRQFVTKSLAFNRAICESSEEIRFLPPLQS